MQSKNQKPFNQIVLGSEAETEREEWDNQVEGKDWIDSFMVRSHLSLQSYLYVLNDLNLMALKSTY